MPLITEHNDGLALFDPSPTDKEQILSLIRSELPPSHLTTLHPSVPATYNPTFTPALTTEHERLASSQSSTIQNGISTARYEALDPPPPSSTSLEDTWRPLLRQAYTSSVYLSDRETSLGLLEEQGRNAWLTANFQLEPIAKALDAELDTVKREIEAVQAARRTAQAEAGAELEALEKAWREGVGRVVQVEVANAELREQVLAKRRELAR